MPCAIPQNRSRASLKRILRYTFIEDLLELLLTRRTHTGEKRSSKFLRLPPPRPQPIDRLSWSVAPETVRSENHGGKTFTRKGKRHHEVIMLQQVQALRCQEGAGCVQPGSFHCGLGLQAVISRRKINKTRPLVSSSTFPSFRFWWCYVGRRNHLFVLILQV